MRRALVLIALAGCAREEVAPKWWLTDEKGAFGVTVVGVRDGIARTRARSIAKSRLTPAQPVRALAVDGRPRVGWIVERAPLFAAPDENSPPVSYKNAFEIVRVEEANAEWVRTHEGFLRAPEVRVPREAPRPVEVAPGERWIDVDTQTQTLGLFDGDTPVFTTLIATGVAARGRLATPRGVHKISWKTPSAHMDSFEAQPPYSLEEVPSVQYFRGDYAIHGAYWHARFGQAVSHGCVNLTPADAARLYAATRATGPSYGGTIVRVR